MPSLSGLVPFASQRLPRLSRHVLASAGYTLDVDSLGAGAFEVWDQNTARRQNRAWLPLVAEAKAGRPRRDIASLREALSTAPAPRGLLEVGCGGGYLSDVMLDWYPDADYLGVDISGAMIELAREQFPTRRFVEGSAYDLPVADGAFDVVDGVALIHMPRWRRAVSEYARVSAGTVVLHGLTLTDAEPTTRFAKYAYGQPTIEFVFNREELTAACNASGLELQTRINGLDYDLEAYLGIPSVSESWVLRRRPTV